MAWLAVDEDGIEVIFSHEPSRGEEVWVDTPFVNNIGMKIPNSYIHLPLGSIEKLIGRKLTWKDEPVEIKYEDEEVD